MDIEEIAKRIVDVAIKVHTILGPSLMESAYQKCMEYELNKDGLTVECEVDFNLCFMISAAYGKSCL